MSDKTTSTNTGFTRLRDVHCDSFKTDFFHLPLNSMT